MIGVHMRHQSDTGDRVMRDLNLDPLLWLIDLGLILIVVGILKVMI